MRKILYINIYSRFRNIKMSKISILRSCVNRGWTIANRRIITQQIGKEKFSEITALAKKVGITGDSFEYTTASKYLTKENFEGTRATLKEVYETTTKNAQKLKETESFFLNDSVKRYNSLDEIYAEPLIRNIEHAPSNMWRFYESDDRELLRSIKLDNGTISKSSEEYLKDRYEMSTFAQQKFPTFEEYKNSYIKEVEARVNRYLSQIPRTTKDCVLWRGVCLNKHAKDKGTREFSRILEDAKPGDIITPDYAATCTSIQPRYALNYLNRDYEHSEHAKKALFKIITRKGAKLPAKGGLREVDLPPFAQYRVLGKQYLPAENTYIYTLEYITPTEPVDYSKFVKF